MVQHGQPGYSLGAILSLCGDFAQLISELVCTDVTFDLGGQTGGEGQGVAELGFIHRAH